MGKKKCSSIGMHIQRQRSSDILPNWNDMRNEFGYDSKMKEYMALMLDINELYEIGLWQRKTMNNRKIRLKEVV